MNRKWRKRILVGAATLALGAGLYSTATGAKGEEPTPRDVAKTAREAPAPEGTSDFRAPMPEPGKVGAPGVVEPRDRAVSLATEVPGVVDEVLVREGSTVAAGTVLLSLHHDVEAAAVAAAEADVAAARSSLTKVLRGARVEEIADLEAQAAAARARADQSSRDLERTRPLVASGAASQGEVDRLAAQARVDERTAAAAEARLLGLRNGSRREDVALARAGVAQAEARLAAARAALDRMSLRAPAAGEVLTVNVRPGEFVNPAGASPLVLGDTSALRVRLDVDERDVSRIAVGGRGFVRAEAFGDRTFSGRVVEVGRRMGTKNVVTGEPGERVDTQVLEVVMELDGRPPLVQGLRVTGFLESAG